MKNLMVISGPSGGGKTTLIQLLLEKYPSIIFSVSHTTRPRRPNEIEGKDYYYLSDDQFKKMVDLNKFAEWATVHEYHYGTSWKEIESNVNGDSILVMDVDVQGAKNLKFTYPDGSFVFIIPPSLEVLQNRILKRENTINEHFKERLRTALSELRQYSNYNYIVINDDIDQAFKVLESIYIANMNLRERNKKYISKLLEGLS